MPRPSLATGRKAKTRKTVADKIADKTSTTTETIPLVSTDTSNSQASGIVSVVPGLVTFTPNDVSGKLPKFVETSYEVTDLLNPPDNLPQATESQFNKGLRIYAGATRALQLSGAGFDLTKERFTVLSKQAKSFSAGIRTASDLEKVRGDYYDYQNILQTNQQKQLTLGVNQHRTTVETSQAVYDKTSLNEKLNQSRIDSNLAKAKSRSKQSVLDEFLKQLGEEVAA